MNIKLKIRHQLPGNRFLDGLQSDQDFLELGELVQKNYTARFSLTESWYISHRDLDGFPSLTHNGATIDSGGENIEVGSRGKIWTVHTFPVAHVKCRIEMATYDQQSPVKIELINNKLQKFHQNIAAGTRAAVPLRVSTKMLTQHALGKQFHELKQVPETWQKQLYSTATLEAEQTETTRKSKEHRDEHQNSYVAINALKTAIK